MSSPAFKLLAPKNNATVPTLLGAIGAADVTIVLNSGHGAYLPTILRGDASSTGDARTLNDTGGVGSVAVGDYIYNLTDGSWAVVITGGANSIRTTPLEGGSLNVWTSGDIWVVGMFVATMTQFSGTTIVKQERVLVTNRVTDTCTVVRGFDSDTAVTFLSGDSFQILVEEAQVEGIHNAIRNILAKIDAIHRGSNSFATSTGSANAYALTLSPKVTALSDIAGMHIVMQANFANTGAATLALNGLTAKNILKEGGVSALASGDIAINMSVILIYNATLDAFVMVNAVANAPAGANPLATLSTKTADYTVTSSDNLKIFDNLASTALITLTLPTSQVGQVNDFVCTDTDGMLVVPGGSDTIDDGSTTGITAGMYSTTLTSVLELLKLKTTQWVVRFKSGTWAAYVPKGFVMGGNSGSPTAQVDTIKFSDDTKSTAVNNLPAAREAGAGIQGPIGKAYYAGGYPAGTSTTTVYRFATLPEVFVTNSDSLTQKCAELLKGVSSSTKGYKIAGYNDGPDTAVVDGITFSTDAVAAITALAVAKYGMGHHNSATAGYACGGDVGGSVQYKLTFSGETWSTLGGTLPAGRAGPGSTQSQTKGYYGGGNPAVNTIAAFTNASDTSATIAGTLSDTRMRMAGFQKSTDGYWCGGYKAAAVNIVNKINFAAETVSTPSATLGSATNSPAGCSNGGVF